jgi:hypothetical protein
MTSMISTHHIELLKLASLAVCKVWISALLLHVGNGGVMDKASYQHQ